MGEVDFPLVSVIVPVYKAEEYIAKCIDSILDQTYENFELILVNDGSPDRSGTICDGYALKDSRIKVIHTPNGGVSYARNTGIDNAIGEYLIFVDSDDWISPEYIQNLLPKQGEDLVHGGYVRIVDEKMSEQVFFKAHTTTQLQWRERFEENWSEGAIMAPWGNSYRRAIIERHHIHFHTDIDVAEDVLFNLEYLKHCNQVRYSEQCDYFYNTDNGDSLMNRHHYCRTQGLMMVVQAMEQLSGKPEYRIRWSEWHTAIAHHRKWLKVSKGQKKQEIIQCLRECYQNDYFRKSIAFTRKYGTLDEKVETFFMHRFLHPMYPRFYRMLVWFSKIKRRIPTSS